MSSLNKGTPLYYDDICLIPNNFSELDTRDNADTSKKFLGKTYSLPVIPANMASVVNLNVCRKLAQCNYFYIMHRFGYVIKDDCKLSVTQDLVKTANEEKWNLVSISTGVNEDSKRDLEWILDYGYRVDVITIDVALGYHQQVEDRIKFIQQKFPNVKIIAGNVAEQKGAQFLTDLGVDAIKVGIAGGLACSTRHTTGFSAPMLWSIAEALKGAQNIPIIADGGIRYIGDIAKAIRFGAECVMIGSLFASCIDSAATIGEDGKKHYYGSASFAAKKRAKNIEGISLTLEPDKTILEKLDEVKQSLQSSISYAGGTSLHALNMVDWLQIR
jgi:GMP reductase